MKLFSCMFQNKIRSVVSILVAVSILLSALVGAVTPALFSVKADNETNTYVLRVAPNATGMPFFGQWVSLKEGKTYVYSNCYLPGTEPYQYIYKDTSDGQITDYEIVYDEDYWRQGLKFTVPSDAMDDPEVEGNKLVWVGFRGHKSSKPLYYYDFKLYDVENNDVNLLKDYALLENGTNINKNVWMSPYNTAIKNTLSKVTLEAAGGMDIFKKSDDDRYVLKLEPNTTGQPVFGQTVSLTVGKTYVFSNYYLPATDAIQWICNSGNIDSPINYEIIDDVEWSKQGAKFTVPESAPDDPDISGNKLIWVGFRGHKSSNPLYYYGFELYDIESPEVNLLKDYALLENGTSFGAAWKSPAGSKINAKYSKVTLKSIGGMDLFKKPIASEPMALALAPNTTGMPWFGQWVTLEKGKTYIFSNCYLPGTDLIHRIYYKHTDGNYDLSDLTGEAVYDSEWSRQGTKFTIPENAPADENGKIQIWVGFRGYKTDKTLYYYDFELYDVENPKTNLLRDSDLLVNDSLLNKAVWKTPGGEVRSTYSKVTLASIGGDSIFKIVPPSGPMALKLEANTSGMPFFGQNVSLEAGKTYIFSNYYLPYTESNQMVCYMGTETKIAYEVVEDIEWSRQGIKFTVPSDAADDPAINGNKLVWVGFRGHKSNSALYYYDLKLYDVDNPEVNLLKDYSFEENGWHLNKSVWVSPYGVINNAYSKVELNSVGGIDIFKNPMASEPMVLVLAPETTGMPFFGQWVTVEKGKTYTFSNCYLPGTDAIQNVYLDANGTELTDYDVTYDSVWSKRSMTFTVPNDAVSDGNGKTRVWVGIRGYSYDGYLYYYNFELYDVENPSVNLIRDSKLQENESQINNSLWKSPYNTAIKQTYGKLTLESVGGEDLFKRTGDVGPKMMYYTRTNRGPNHETYGCFTISIPEELHVVGQNYVLQFDARSIKGIGLKNFRCGAIDPALALDENNTIEPASIEGYTYSFNLRFTDDMTKKLSLMIFVPEGAEGYISNIYMYEADSNFNKVSNRDLLKNAYGDFSHLEVGNYVGLYAKQGGCVGTETGKLEAVPQYFFEIPPSVSVPSGDKMMSYASVWGAGTIVIELPHTVKKGSVDGKNYIVSLTIRPTKGRDPSKFHSTGINGEHVQVYPTSIDGYKYTFNLTERYDFSLVLEFPADCEGYISNLQMYAADEDFKPLNSVNLATAFGKNGTFSNITKQQGMKWDGITFNGGFVNTFIDTRALTKELKNGTLGEYHSSGGIWPIPENYFVAEKDEGWADAYMTDTSDGNGKIVGKIEDSSGEIISACEIVLKSMQDTTDVKKETSDKKGEFCFESVPVGGYEVSIVTKNGNEVLGDMFVWVEEAGDIVTMSLVYDGDFLAVGSSNNISALGWVLIGVGALVVIGTALFVILFVKRKYKKS